MRLPEKALHVTYAITITWLINSLVTSTVDLAQIKDITLFIFLGAIGATLLFLGLFKTQSGLSAGLVISGITCSLRASYKYLFYSTLYLKFVLALAMLLMTGYALYKLQTEESVL
ncbi:MAG: hypothetical protein NTZ68_02990 [Candidatus Dependentiae bacterium]|nr:hypothetical protein [Candidatus Dependentiae bacterium]